jgi:hypothetical protein
MRHVKKIPENITPHCVRQHRNPFKERFDNAIAALELRVQYVIDKLDSNCYLAFQPVVKNTVDTLAEAYWRASSFVVAVPNNET